MGDSDRNDNLNILIDAVRHYAQMNFDNARITLAEKLIRLFTAVAFAVLLIITGGAVMFFVSIGVGHFLAETIAPVYAYIYVAAFYVVLLILLLIFRRRLLLNPISRFITRLLLRNPEEDN